MLKKLIFIFSIFCCVAPAYGLTLKVKRSGDAAPLEIPLHATKRTERALAVKTSDGTIYYADMRPVGHSFPGGMFTRIDGQIYQVGVAPSTFSITTTPDTDSFSFSMSAKGNFTIDWGDGQTQTITRTDTNEAIYSHTYSTAGTYIIGFDGNATGYAVNVAAISFHANQNVSGIHGSLGAIFSTIGDGSGAGQQPSFDSLFASCPNLTGSIPANLFTGVHGQPVDYMFRHIFFTCTNLTGPIPAGLFAGVSGTITRELFRAAFGDCFSLSGSIPEKLFAGVSGTPTYMLFGWTFMNCWNLTGQIPDNLFGNISGTMERYAFRQMFQNASGLTGPSAKINGKYLYEIWPDADAEYVWSCYGNDRGLSDYSDIPDTWK